MSLYALNGGILALEIALSSFLFSVEKIARAMERQTVRLENAGRLVGRMVHRGGATCQRDGVARQYDSEIIYRAGAML
jgi:hypothetical protein